MRNILLHKIFIVIALNTFLNGAGTTFINKICKLESSQPYGWYGDSNGKRFATKERYSYLCETTHKAQGECNKWETIVSEVEVPEEQKYTYYISKDHSGSLGQTLAVIEGYNKINGLWSGWKGICQFGKDDGNFDWLSDPYVLASYAISAYSANASSNASQITNQAARKSAEVAVKYATCSARAGLDAAKMMEDYEDDGVECDPIDEFCNGEENYSNNEGMIFTLDETKYNQFLNESPDYAKYMKIIKGLGTGIVTVKVINPANENGSTADSMKMAQEAEKKVKDEMFKIRAAFMTIQIATCYFSGSSTQSEQNASPFSVQNLAVSAIGMINPIAGIALSVAMNTFSSLQNIDTCTNKEDAKEKGKRHEATYDARQLKQCHQTGSETKGGTFSKRTKNKFCCYDDRVTRILVEQAKAQLGKDWQHCTDISLKEIQFLKFKPCDPTELDNDVDGTKLGFNSTYAQRKNAYQFKNQCIDTREYVAYMLDTFGGEDQLIDEEEIKDTLNNLR